MTPGALLDSVTAHSTGAYAGTPIPTGAGQRGPAQLYWVLLPDGPWGPLTEAEVVEVAETTVALTGQPLDITPAN